MRGLWIIALLGGCNDPELTGIELTVRYDPSLALDQLVISGSLEDGSEAFAPGLLPESPRPLVDGEDSLVLLLSDALSGTTVELKVEGMSNGTIAADGRVGVAVASRKITGASVDLEEIIVEGCDAGLCPPVDGGVDAAVEDAGAGEDGAVDAGDTGTVEDAGMIDADAEPPDIGMDTGVDEDIGPIDVGEPDTGCLPEAPVIGDGIDQDCDGFDECYQDLDEDGFGTAAVVSDDDLDCANASRPTAVVDTDCDDGDPLVFPGTVCNDGSGTSENDVCLGPVCRGYETSGCASSCSGCGAGACCSRDCPGGNCGLCPTDCSCDFDSNNDNTSTATCESGAVCHLFANSGNNATLTCGDGASCDLECNSTSTCELECVGNALCIISSCNSSSCTLNCTGAPMSCPGGIQVCNRACP